MSHSPETSVHFHCGTIAKNRFMLSPLTNQQSHEDGSLSEDEYNWLEMRAKGQFGIVMTCASHVQEIGKGFPGQLGIFSDRLISDHQRLTTAIKSYGSLALIQLHHAGMRSPAELIQQSPVCPSSIKKYRARALLLEEVHQLRNDFIDAAVRAQNSGYDGVEVHGAHGYIISQFLSKEINNRNDDYGGSLENRSRILFEIINGIREKCGQEFMVGIRLSPERFGMDLKEIKWVCQKLIDDGNIDFLDISLWDVFKEAHDEKYRECSLLEHFTSLDFKKVKLTVAGKIKSGGDVHKLLDSGVDFVTIGRSAILHHDFPKRVMQDPNFIPVSTPVTKEYLIKEGLGDAFVEYMRNWPNFVKE